MNTHRHHGFTLIETMIAISLAAVLLGAAAPSFVDTVRNNQLATSANTLVGALQTARTTAIRDGRDVTLCVSNDQSSCTGGTSWSDGWILWSDRNRNDSLDDGELLRIGEAQANVALTAAGQSSFVFSPSGLVNAGDTVDVCHGSGNASGRMITISPVGGVSLDRDHSCS